MSPQLNHVSISLNCLGACLRNSLEDLADVSQVIGVMTLGWSWSKSLRSLEINLDSSLNQVLLHILDAFAEGW
jgi:hypothetical protein